MGWRRQIFGSDCPSRKRYTALGTTYGAIALCFYGFWVDFVPVAWLSRDAWIVAGILGVAGAGWLAWATVTGRITPHRVSRTTFVLLSPFSAALIAMLLWCIVVRGIGGGITRVTGEMAALPPIVMHTDDSYRRHECGPQLRGASLGGFMQDHLCISSAYYWAHQDHRVEIQILGRRGTLGFYIKGFRHLRDLGPYRRD